MLLVKAKNAAELFWDSLDSEEKRLVLVYAAYLIGSLLVAWQRGSRERLKREIREEIASG